MKRLLLTLAAALIASACGAASFMAPVGQTLGGEYSGGQPGYVLGHGAYARPAGQPRYYVAQQFGNTTYYRPVY